MTIGCQKDAEVSSGIRCLAVSSHLKAIVPFELVELLDSFANIVLLFDTYFQIRFDRIVPGFATMNAFERTHGFFLLMEETIS